MNKKIIYVVIAVVVVCAGVIIGKNIINNENTVETSKNYNNLLNENKIVNKTNTAENKIGNEATNEIQNEVENTVGQENIEEEHINSESKEDVDTKDDKEKAIEIAKEDWGEDDSVSFKFDRIDSKGNYIVVVRDKATTNALKWYTIDVEEEKVID